MLGYTNLLLEAARIFQPQRTLTQHNHTLTGRTSVLCGKSSTSSNSAGVNSAQESVCVFLQTAGCLEERYEEGTHWHWDRHVTVALYQQGWYCQQKRAHCSCRLSIWHQRPCFYWDMEPVRKLVYRARSAAKQLFFYKRSALGLEWNPRRTRKSRKCQNQHNGPDRCE